MQSFEIFQFKCMRSVYTHFCDKLTGQNNMSSPEKGDITTLIKPQTIP
jgi:hypothetical protein